MSEQQLRDEIAWLKAELRDAANRLEWRAGSVPGGVDAERSALARYRRLVAEVSR